MGLCDNYYKYSILSVCDDLHSDACGSGERLDEDKRREFVSWLRYRLDHSVRPCDYQKPVTASVEQVRRDLQRLAKDGLAVFCAGYWSLTPAGRARAVYDGIAPDAGASA